MRRWLVTAALLAALGAALQAWAGDADDCTWPEPADTILKTNPDRVLSACRRLAEQGVVAAQYNLGAQYYGGHGVPQNYGEAVKWFRKAAEQGAAEAETALGVMYAEGLGARQDDVEAMTWFRKAVDQNFSVAKYNLGLLYFLGQGVPRDYVQAYMWFSLAADQGNADAAYNRDIVAAKMTPAQIDQAKALAAAWKPTTGQ
jgi:TPR repeat protein